MSAEDIRALQELWQYRDIVIMLADKGGKIVIWAVDQYIKKLYEQLSDTKYFQLQDTDYTTSRASEL